MPDYRRIRIPGHPLFLTIVTHERNPWLGDPEAVALLLDAMRRAKTKYPFRHLADVILPDHLHWLLLPSAESAFSDLVAALKRQVSWRRKEAGGTGPLWQKRFYDHLIRDDDDLGRHLDYIHFNPVKHGYVSRTCDDPWSSFDEWVKRGVYPADWGSAEPERIAGMNPE